MARKANHYRRMAKAALDTAAVSDGGTAAKFHLLAADYAAEADRLADFERDSGELVPPHKDVSLEEVSLEQPLIEQAAQDHSPEK
jgi:hypothetical protein